MQSDRVTVNIRVTKRDVHTARLEASRLAKLGIDLRSKELRSRGGFAGYQTIINAWISDAATRARKNRGDRLRRKSRKGSV